MKFYKYQAAGNDFVMIDETKELCGLTEEQRVWLCDRRFGVGADGIIYLRHSELYDFEMIYHNSDGKEASMCGNGGRAIVRFAHDLGFIGETCHFIAVDGEHNATVEKELIRLEMQNVDIPDNVELELIQTGSPHFIQTVENLATYDVFTQGRLLRNDLRFAPEGCNVNFVEEISANEIHQRTYERGVEDETLACGTGAVAGAVYQAVKHGLDVAEILIHMRGGDLRVKLERNDSFYENVWLCGSAEKSFEGQVDFTKISPKLGVL